LFRR